MNILEQSCGKLEGQTTARRQIPLLPPLRMLEEFTVGLGIDTNMAEMMIYFSENQEEPVTGESIWERSDMKPEDELRRYYQYNHIADGDERLVMPTFGSYKMIYTD